MNQNNKEQILKILNSIPKEFRVIENSIKSEILSEYYDIVDEIEFLDDKEANYILKQSDCWEKLRTDKELKYLLTRLSEIGDIKSYRKIEEIINNTKSSIKEFGHVSLKFARLNLENQLSDEPIGFISSELGGRDNKLRYYFVIKSNKKITKERESAIENHLIEISKVKGSELEEIENLGDCALIKILVSIDIAIGDVIETLIDKYHFIDKEYICTNVEKPTIEFIEKWKNNEL